MKKLITVSLLLICVSISFSQSKKQQIETLTYKLDSINSVLLRSIDDNEKLSDTKLVLESKISLLKNENASKNGEISLKNEKIESLTKEVKSLEQDYQLVVADLILKSDSLDSISLKLDSIINLAKLKEQNENNWVISNNAPFLVSGLWRDNCSDEMTVESWNIEFEEGFIIFGPEGGYGGAIIQIYYNSYTNKFKITYVSDYDHDSGILYEFLLIYEDKGSSPSLNLSVSDMMCPEIHYIPSEIITYHLCD